MAGGQEGDGLWFDACFWCGLCGLSYGRHGWFMDAVLYNHRVTRVHGEKTRKNLPPLVAAVRGKAGIDFHPYQLILKLGKGVGHPYQKNN